MDFRYQLNWVQNNRVKKRKEFWVSYLKGQTLFGSGNYYNIFH